MVSLQAMTTPRPGAELVASGGRAGYLNNLIPMKQDEADRLRREVEALIGKDTPMSFGGYTAPVFPGIAYAGMVLFFKRAIPYSDEGDKLADAQIAYIHQILGERLKGIVELSDVPEVGEHVRGMSLPRIAVKTTKVVGGILVTLVPTVDERYSSAHRILRAALDLSVANGMERLAEASKPVLAEEKGEVLPINKLDIRDKKLLVRFDFNVPMDKDGNIIDDTRIRAALPTINYAIKEGGARSIVMGSHLGKPDGKYNPNLTMGPVAKRLNELLGGGVAYTTDWELGNEAKAAADGLPHGGILLLENFRFHPGEEANDPDFSRRLAGFGEVYIDDAFGTAHRSHASTVGVTNYIPVKGAGFLMMNEIEILNMMREPKKPAVAVSGGAKIADKFDTVLWMVTSGKFDVVLIGGGMANTFLKAKGYNLGNSLVEDTQVGMARWLLKEAERSGVKITVPIDVVIANKYSRDAKARVVNAEDVPEGWMILDIGPRTIESFGAQLNTAKTVFWNGTMGVSEWTAFQNGTRAVARMIVDSDSKALIGGGDTIAALNQFIPAENIDREGLYTSTGGGASLEWLARGNLPAITALRTKASAQLASNEGITKKEPVDSLIQAANIIGKDTQETQEAYDSLAADLTTQADQEQDIIKEIPVSARLHLASNEGITRKEQVDSLYNIVAISAKSIIDRENGKEWFEKWMLSIPVNIAVVIIAENIDEYERVKDLGEMAYIKVVGDPADESIKKLKLEKYQILNLQGEERNSLFDELNLYGAGINLGAKHSLDPKAVKAISVGI